MQNNEVFETEEAGTSKRIPGCRKAMLLPKPASRFFPPSADGGMFQTVEATTYERDAIVWRRKIRKDGAEKRHISKEERAVVMLHQVGVIFSTNEYSACDVSGVVSIWNTFRKTKGIISDMDNSEKGRWPIRLPELKNTARFRGPISARNGATYLGIQSCNKRAVGHTSAICLPAVQWARSCWECHIVVVAEDVQKVLRNTLQ